MPRPPKAKSVTARLGVDVGFGPEYESIVVANGSISFTQPSEGDIRQALVKADLVDCMVALLGQFFYNYRLN